MERSAINSYTAAGACLGFLFGLWTSDKLIGTGHVEYFVSLTTLLAALIAALSWWLISRRYKKARRRERLFYAVSGWVVLFMCAGSLVAGIAAIFPKPGGGLTGH